MANTKKISNTIKLNFHMNLLNFLPFLFVVITGLVLQIGYHMHQLPDEHLISVLNRSGWLLAHKMSALISLFGITVHCILHWKYIFIKSKSILQKKSMSKVQVSYWLFIISIPVLLTAMISWIFFDIGSHGRHVLVEVHDKAALLFIVFSVIHIVSRAGWMIRTGNKLLPH